MTQDEIIEMAREASGGAKVPDILIPVFERFAKLIAQHEREACANICKEMYLSGDMDTGLAEEAIRARGQA